MKLKIFSVLAIAMSGATAYANVEGTANQPGFNATANAGVYPGKGLLGVVTYGHYRLQGVNEHGTDHASPKYTSVDVLLPHLSYYTDKKILGGFYSFGATAVIGGLYYDHSGVQSGVSRSPWLTPLRLNWTVGDDVHLAAGYTFRLGSGLASTSTDKTYDVHILNSNLTYNINEQWQLNGSVSIEHRTKDLRQNQSWQPGNIGYFEGSAVYKFESGRTLGAYGYHVTHLNRDKGTQFTPEGSLIMGSGYANLTGIGAEFTTPISMLKSTMSVRIFSEPSRSNHMYGTRAFVSLTHKF
ncbi:hypothetical protein JCM19235_2294 [Vibrio maritimus]|uniref:Transporter n=1 Tax=Vibrio maritimus TaxID=990268 RepID=A0A090RUA1_9VIBR|nr:hypothetical protein JCM19235_2294 [Vibrio maritimus]